MTEQADLVWTLLASLLIGNTLLLVLNLPLAPLWARLLRIPRPYLYAGILFFASLGAYTANLEAFDLFLLLVFGLLGLAMRRFALPVLPLILGVILGPLMETKLREALTISDGDLSGLFNEPLAVVVYVIIALLVVAPIVLHRVRPDLEPAALVPPEDAPTTARRLAGGGPMSERSRSWWAGRPTRTAGRPCPRRSREATAARPPAGGVNATKGDALVDERYAADSDRAALESELAASGRAPRGPADDGRGRGRPGAGRGRRGLGEPGRDRAAPPLAGGQADHGQRRPADPARAPTARSSP